VSKYKQYDHLNLYRYMETLENRLQKRIYVSLYALLFLTVLLAISVLLEGCSDSCEVRSEYTYFEPVYTTVAEIRASISLKEPQPMKGNGRIGLKDGLLLVSDPVQGIHIFDNRNPAYPIPLKYLSIPGTYDLAMKDNILYADRYVDLVAFDISNVNTIHEVARLEGVFKNYYAMGFQADASCCVITEWKETKNVHVSSSDCNVALQPWGGVYYAQGIALQADAAAAFSSKAAIAPGSGSGPGLGGSLTRFTLNEDRLYMLDGADIQAVNVTAANNPVATGRRTVSGDIETIFPYKENLFIGAATGMYILSVSNPDEPSVVGTYAHVTSCDPVVVDDHYAYVTLRTGTVCEGFINQLEIIDVQNPASPALMVTYPMTNPHGLGIDDKTLFICDGNAGLKAFDITNINTVAQNILAHYKDINATDVIPFNDVLILVGSDGIFQYDYSDPANISLLSHLPTN
jgi:hypothetical protein